MTEQVLEPDDLALFVDEAVDGRSHTPDRFDLLGTGRQRDQRAVGLIREVDGGGRSALFTPQCVDAGASRNRRQPGSEVATRFEALGVAPGLEEHVLRDVLGSLRIADHPVGNGVDQPTESVVQRTNS